MKPLRQLKHWLTRRPRAVPTVYRGVRFRSSLEADWAHTLDCLDIVWSYEPIAIQLNGGVNYRPDFYLPNQRVWCEVKGPHDIRIDKPRRLLVDLNADEFDTQDSLVAILRIPIRGMCVVEGVWPSPHIDLVQCAVCENWTFVDLDGAWVCRVCRQWNDLFGGGERARFWQLDPYNRRVA